MVVVALILYGIILVGLTSLRILENARKTDGERALTIANLVAKVVEPERIEGVLEINSMEDASYLDLQREIYEIGTGVDVKYLYTFKQISDEEIMYIVDGSGTMDDIDVMDPLGGTDSLSNYDFSSKNNINAGKYLEREDEIGNVIRAMQRMEGKVRELLGKTIESSGGISASSEELTASASEKFNSISEISDRFKDLAGSISAQAVEAQDGTKAIIPAFHMFGRMVSSPTIFYSLVNLYCLLLVSRI